MLLSFTLLTGPLTRADYMTPWNPGQPAKSASPNHHGHDVEPRHQRQHGQPSKHAKYSQISAKRVNFFISFTIFQSDIFNYPQCALWTPEACHARPDSSSPRLAGQLIKGNDDVSSSTPKVPRPSRWPVLKTPYGVKRSLRRTEGSAKSSITWEISSQLFSHVVLHDSCVHSWLCVA
ncbi:hypothetical protein B0T09DRAFT_33559 [Sordaria sp. MPI-SDFR-AT-0083]|nr:hypothetical protein B0T09DRAFT_33559 [Sordaria sp. MPI-SDFR-AT-0083]